MRTFATEGRKFETKQKKKKKKSNSGWNEIFLKRFFFLWLQRKIGMTELFKYPLMSIPLSIAHIDGTIQKTPKSSLLGNY